MSEFISREEAEERLLHLAEVANSAYDGMFNSQIVMLAQNVIHMMPAADVVERDKYNELINQIESVKKTRMRRSEIEKNFSYHAPKEGQPERYERIRKKAKAMALHIEDACPDSREKSLAFTKLEEAVMWANAAIARNE